MFNLIEYIKHKSVNLVGGSTVKLNANAQEFVPQLKKQEPATDGAMVDFQTIKPDLEERKTKCKLTLPWKGFPRKTDKPAGSTQIVLLNDVDYMIVPRAKSTKRAKDETLLAGKEKQTVPKVEKPSKENVPVTSTVAKLFDIEKRREKERKVAVEALKLVEQRRMRGALLTQTTAQNSENLEAPARQPIIHLSRSPIRYTPEERIKVDRLRAAKKERIERVLREMHYEKMEQENRKKLQLNKVPLAPTENKSVVVTAARRYIPTTKEWDEQCRAKQQALTKSNVVVNVRSTEMVKREDHPKTTDIPRYRPPSQLLMGEKRKGNLTHSLPIPNWAPRRLSQTLPPLRNRMGKLVQRYSIEQLLLLEPQPEELEKPDLDKGLTRLHIVYE